MKLLRYGPAGEEKPGLIDDAGRIRDLSGHIEDIDADFIASGRLKSLIEMNYDSLPLIDSSPRLGPPLKGVGKIVAIGLNYAEHIKETGAGVPDEPRIFTKATTAINGPNDPVMLPKGSTHTDWEVELAVVIGIKAQYVDEKNALDHVLGYTIMNDVSEREYQKNRGGQWVKGKSCDTFAPIGPWLVTRNEIADPQKLNLWLEINSEVRQQSNTSKMLHGVAWLVSYLSRFMTLMPGDIITTGTPSGVGLGCVPPQFLKPGDVIRLGIEGLGEQRQEVIAWKPAAS